MIKRMVLMLCAVTAFVAVIGFVKFRQVQAAIAQASSYQPPAEAVTTIVARQELWQTFLGSIGTVEAVNGVVLTADLPGIVETIAFESGASVEAGEPLMSQDVRQERAQLLAAEAKRDLDRANFERARGLQNDRIISQADFDAAQTAYNESQAGVGVIRATIERKTLKAPFSGVLGIRQVNLGQYLKSGDAIVPLQSLDPIYVNFSVPQQELPRMSRGREVRVTSDAAPGGGPVGRITAVDSIVDPSTRNVQVQATFGNRDGALHPGMFVKAEVVLDAKDPVVPLPASAISYAPYGDSVYVVEDLKNPSGQTYKGVRQQFVKLGSARGDQVAVLSGVKPGEEIVTSGAFKLRNGAAVQVNNETQPGNDPSPRPEDN